MVHNQFGNGRSSFPVPGCHDRTDGDHRPNVRSENHRWEGTSIFGVEQRRWGVLRSLKSKTIFGELFFDLRGRMTNVGRLLRFSKSEDRRCTGSTIFESPKIEGPHSRKKPIFEHLLYIFEELLFNSKRNFSHL